MDPFKSNRYLKKKMVEISQRMQVDNKENSDDDFFDRNFGNGLTELEKICQLQFEQLTQGQSTLGLDTDLASSSACTDQLNSLDYEQIDGKFN